MFFGSDNFGNLGIDSDINFEYFGSGINFENLDDDITGHEQVHDLPSDTNDSQDQTTGYSYAGLFYSAVRSRLVGANETDQRRYKAAYGQEASAPAAYYQRALSWGCNKATSAVRNVLPTPVVAVADFIMGQQADPNAQQAANIDFRDQLKQLMAHPASKK